MVDCHNGIRGARRAGYVLVEHVSNLHEANEAKGEEKSTETVFHNRLHTRGRL